MNLEVVSERENPLFSRREVTLKVEADVVPSMTEARDAISEKYSSDKELIRIREIKSRFGSRTFLIIADIYESKEEFDRIVKKTKKELKAEEEARRAAEEAKKAEEEAKKEENSEGESSE